MQLQLTVLVLVELKCRFCPKMPATMDTKANITVIITTICTTQNAESSPSKRHHYML